MKFTFAIVNRMLATEVRLGVGTPNWESFVRAQAIRNRITHPKVTNEFMVPDPEIEVAKATCSWFNDIVATMFESLSRNAAGKSEDGGWPTCMR